MSDRLLEAQVRETGVPPRWACAVNRWFHTSTRQFLSRRNGRAVLMKAGRWVAHTQPRLDHPDQWTREVAAEWVAAVLSMKKGDFCQTTYLRQGQQGIPISPRHKMQLLSALNVFFRDCQEWEWIPRRFDPRRAFAVPRMLLALIHPNPKPLPDDLWAKALSAGLQLGAEDLASLSPRWPTRRFYPIEMVRAVAMVWLFSGLRSDEIVRLRVGCATTKVLDEQRGKTVCLLEVPTNKTSRSFVKPVDPIVAAVIDAWEQVRPQQARFIDRKTGEPVPLLFAFRGRPLAPPCLNHTVIPLICTKAGIPRHDRHGTITSHRARSTMATQLLNSPDHPMTVFELQQWLGHRSVSSTLHYLAITPTRLSESFLKSNHTHRNLRTVQVLIDQDVVLSGDAGTQPWKFYDLGHGYCRYDFFEQCPHRMACAKCSFYLPKGSTETQLLEGKINLLKMRQEIPLQPAELAAVDEGIEAFERLLTQLRQTPTPAGLTPLQIDDAKTSARESGVQAGLPETSAARPTVT